MKETSTRERILDAAEALIQVRGFGATSTGDILKTAGVTKGTLYHHFASKDELGLELLRRDRQRFMALLDDSLADTAPEVALENFFAAALRKHNDTGFVGGCLWGNTALEMGDANPAYRALVREVFDEWVGKIAAVLESGQAAGCFRADRKADELARVVVGAIEGGIMFSRLSKTDHPFRTCLDSLRVLLKETGGRVGSRRRSA